MQWGHDADAKLFMHVLKIHDVKLNYEALARAMGHDVTAKALMHRIGKLKAMAGTSPSPATNNQPAASAKTTGNGKANANTNAKDKKKNDKSTTAAGKAPKRTANGSVKNANGAVVAAGGGGGNGEIGFTKDGGHHDDDEEEEEEEGRAKPLGKKRAKVELAAGEDAAAVKEEEGA